MKRHNHRPPRRRTCDLCVHRRAGRIVRETYREIQVQRRQRMSEGLNYPPEARRAIRKALCIMISRANFNQPTLWMAV